MTKVVALFMEAIRRPDEFVAGLDQLRAAGKHVVILKAGSTEAGARATAAHTGALASDDDVVDAMLQRHQVPRVHSFEDLLATAMTLEQLGPASGPRVGILTTSGGAGVVAAESAERAGFELPGPAPATRERLAAAAPDFAAISNPADMSGMFSEREEIFTESLAALAAAEEFDQLMLVLTVHPPDISQRLAELVLRGVQATATPLAVLWMAGGMSAPSIAWLREQGLAVYDDAERCGRALAARAFLGRAADAAESPELLPLPAPGPFADTLLESEAMELLAGADVPVPVTLLTTDPESAAAAAKSIAGPVAVKAAARDLLHRSDIGGVVLGVSSGAEAAAAHTRVVQAALEAGASPEGSVVQQMSPAGVELIVGVGAIPSSARAGGRDGRVTTELQADVSRRLLPLREGKALAMLQDLRTFALLAGYRRAGRRRRRRRPGDRWARPSGGGARRPSGGDRGQPADRRPGRRGRRRRADHPRRDEVSTGLIASSRNSRYRRAHSGRSGRPRTSSRPPR